MNERVAETFRRIYLENRTGLLVCEEDEVKRSITFRSGFVVGARSSRVEDRLGEILIRHGRITKQQFDDASHFIKSGWKLGAILAELAIIKKEEIEHFLLIQLLEIGKSVLLQPPRRLTFSPLASVDAVVPHPLPIGSIILEAARQTPDIDKLRERLLKEERRLVLASNPVLRAQQVSLSPEEAYVLSRVDGEQAASAILAVSPLSEEQTVRTLSGLLLAGIIEPEGAEPHRAKSAEPEKPRTEKPVEAETKAPGLEEIRGQIEQTFEEFHKKDHWDVLGVPRGATPDEVRQAYFKLARRYHPDRYRRIADEEIMEKVSFVFRRVTEAYETLSTQTKAEDYQKLADKESQYAEQQKGWTEPGQGESSPPPRTRDAAAAKVLFARAKKAYDVTDYWVAIQFCQQAIEIVSDQAAYYHLLGLALAKNPKWRLDAEKNLKIATNLDPWKAEYLLALGELYQSAGMPLRATKMFEQARAIDPGVKLPDEN